MPLDFEKKKKLQNWENAGLFLIWKQPVFGCKIGKIKSLETVLLSVHNICFG